jgi:pathogen-inducible salicylic acid glucosyltransferase
VPSAFLDNRLPEDTSYGFHLYTPLTGSGEARRKIVGVHNYLL